MALQAIRGEVVSLDAHSANFFNCITFAETKRRKEAAANDENTDIGNTGASFTPHTPSKVRLGFISLSVLQLFIFCITVCTQKYSPDSLHVI